VPAPAAPVRQAPPELVGLDLALDQLFPEHSLGDHMKPVRRSNSFWFSVNFSSQNCSAF
jgi:hypothetical protein